MTEKASFKCPTMAEQRKAKTIKIPSKLLRLTFKTSQEPDRVTQRTKESYMTRRQPTRQT